MLHNTKKKQIILVRHAKAIERTEWTEKDFDRPLTESGINSNRIVANYLRLIQCKPDKSIAEVVQIIKGGSAFKIRKTHPELEEFLWGDSFWADGYFAESVGVHQEEMIKKYINDQGQ